MSQCTMNQFDDSQIIAVPDWGSDSDSDGTVNVEFSDGWDDVIECSSDCDENEALYAQNVHSSNASVKKVETNDTAASPTSAACSEKCEEIENITGKVLFNKYSGIKKEEASYFTTHEAITAKMIASGFYELTGSHIISGEKIYSQSHIRLYFDIDIKERDGAMDIYNEVLATVDKLKPLFGDASISGYTNDRSISQKTQCRQNYGASKALSLHIVFYESRLTIEDLRRICSKTSFILPDWIDASVYGIGKRRVFRHHLSPHTKFGVYGLKKDGTPQFKRNATDDKYCPGKIFDDKPLHTQILQPIGTEKLISFDDVIKSCLWFEKQPNADFTSVKKVAAKVNDSVYFPSDYEAELVDANTLNSIMKRVDADVCEVSNDASMNRAISNENCLRNLLSCFKPTFANLQHAFWLTIVNSPFEKDRLKEIVKEWYWKGNHSTPNGDANYIEQEYVNVNREVSDIWFYCAINHLPNAVKAAFIDKYAHRSVNTEVKFDVWDTFSLNDLQKAIMNHKYTIYCAKTVTDDKSRKNALKLSSEYGVEKMKNEDGSLKSVTVKRFPVINFGRILTDLRRCFVIVDSTPRTYIFKGYDGLTGKMCIDRTMHTKVAKDKLKFVTIKYLDNDMKTKSIDLWSLVNHDNNGSYMSYLSAEFYSTNPNVFSYYYPSFKQCAYDTIDSAKTDYKTMNNLERWVHHVNSVICSGDEDSIKYIHGWIARALQNPLKKNKTALVIKDVNQGTGKSWFAETVAHLHGKFGNGNVGNMKTICGDFNASIDNQTLIVVNEVNDVDNSVYYNGDKLKTLITEDEIEIERKGIDAEKRRIFANFIFVSNNEMPIRVDDKDRRYMILRPSAVHGKDDHEYWSDDFYNLKDDETFLSQLYSYYMNLDIGYYNPKAIPVTIAKEEIIEQARPRIHDFIIDNYDLLVKGWAKDYAFDEYMLWCKRNNYQNPGNVRTFNNNISEYVEWTMQKTHGQSKAASRTLPKKQINGKRVFIYKLNENSVERFKSMDEDMICSDCDEEVNTIDENVKELTD